MAEWKGFTPDRVVVSMFGNSEEVADPRIDFGKLKHTDEQKARHLQKVLAALGLPSLDGEPPLSYPSAEETALREFYCDEANPDDWRWLASERADDLTRTRLQAIGLGDD